MPDITSRLKALKLHGMAECHAEIQAQNPESIDLAAPLLRQLLEAEATDPSDEFRQVSNPSGFAGV